MVDIVDSSPKALAMIEPGTERKLDTFVNNHHRSKYKFEQLNIGQSMIIPITESELSIRQLSTRYGKKYKKKFTVLKHYGVIEVARIG